MSSANKKHAPLARASKQRLLSLKDLDLDVVVRALVENFVFYRLIGREEAVVHLQGQSRQCSCIYLTVDFLSAELTSNAITGQGQTRREPTAILILISNQRRRNLVVPRGPLGPSLMEFGLSDIIPGIDGSLGRSIPACIGFAEEHKTLPSSIVS